jgi:phage tail tube protein FII
MPLNRIVCALLVGYEKLYTSLSFHCCRHQIYKSYGMSELKALCNRHTSHSLE